MKFLADETIHGRTVDRLRSGGHDVSAVSPCYIDLAGVVPWVFRADLAMIDPVERGLILLGVLGVSGAQPPGASVRASDR